MLELAEHVVVFALISSDLMLELAEHVAVEVILTPCLFYFHCTQDFLSGLLVFHRAAELKDAQQLCPLGSQGQLVKERDLDQLQQCGSVDGQLLVHSP